VPTIKVVPYFSLEEDPFSRGLLRSVRSTDAERRYRRGVRSHPAPGLLFITTYVTIDSVESPPPERRELFIFWFYIIKTRPVFTSLPSIDRVI
jgi:hypothetical protein